MSSSNQQTLHPAAVIFRDQVIAGVKEENARLSSQVARLLPLYEVLNSVKVVATTNQEPVPISFEQRTNGGLTINANPTNEVFVETSLLDGRATKLENDGDGSSEELQFLINSSPLRMQNLGGGRGGIGLSVSGASMGFFPTTPFGRGKTALWVNEEDDSVRFVFLVKEGVEIEGTLLGLSEESKLTFMNGERPSDYFRHALGLPIPLPFVDGHEELAELKFVPAYIGLRLTSDLERRVSLLKEVASTNTSNAVSSSCAEIELRFLVADALGEEIHKTLLQENHRLQQRLEALDCLRTYALRVEIAHSTGTLVCALDSGHELSHTEEREWDVVVPEHEGNVMVLKDVHRSSFRLGGASVGIKRMLGQRFIHTTTSGTTLLLIPYERGCTAIATVMGTGWSDEERAQISDDPHFHTRVGMAIMGGAGSYVDGDGTPLAELSPKFKIKVHKILFKHYDKLLRLCGRDELLEQD